jgi:hypothetical protein
MHKKEKLEFYFLRNMIRVICKKARRLLNTLIILFIFICMLLYLNQIDRVKHNITNEFNTGDLFKISHDEDIQNLSPVKLSKINDINSCQSDLNNLNLIRLNSNLPVHEKCSTEDWIFVDDFGYLTYNYEFLIKNDIQISYCEYATINWYYDDFNYQISAYRKINNGSQLDISQEFFHIYCYKKSFLFLSYFKTYYKTTFARIFKKAKEEVSKNNNKQPLNIFMLGLDSVSREDWLEKLPKSSQFFLNTIKSNVLSRYNIVNDGTPAALIPLLTGKHEHELPNTIKNTQNPKHVDLAYPFIWKDYENELGYATLFAEDWPEIGTFQYRMIGFSQPPVRHYLRYFI